jgi:hypothetical protein
LTSNSPLPTLVLLVELAVAENHPLLAGQPLQADRSARVDLVGRNSDFRTQAILETIGEARRGIDHHRRRIDLTQETQRLRVVLGDDRIGVVRSVAVDVPDGFVETGNHLDRDDRRQEFAGEIVLGRRLWLR